MYPATYPFDAETLVDICQEHGAAMVAVFGSMARAEADENSDLDLVVEFRTGKSLLALVALERKLSAALGRKVDLLTVGAISPYLRDRILGEMQVIYDALVRHLPHGGSAGGVSTSGQDRVEAG